MNMNFLFTFQGKVKRKFMKLSYMPCAIFNTPHFSSSLFLISKLCIAKDDLKLFPSLFARL